MTNLTLESMDHELSLDELNSIAGGGKTWDKIKGAVKRAAKKAGDWTERTFGDGDGKHEFWDDYADEVFKVATIAIGAAGVWGGPSEGDRTGLPG